MNEKYSSFMKSFSEPYLADVGRIICAWSHIEFIFDSLFISIVVMKGANEGSLSDPKVRQMGMAFERRVRAMRDHLISMNLPSEKYKKWDAALSRLMNLRNERDTIGHSQFSPSFSHGDDGMPYLESDTAIALCKSWRNQKPHKHIKITQDDLKKTFQKMEALFWELNGLKLHEYPYRRF
jgi:hypothetical protein